MGLSRRDFFQTSVGRADALRTKAASSRIEAQEHDLAGRAARQNEQFVQTSTEIKEFQTQWLINQTLGQQLADVVALRGVRLRAGPAAGQRLAGTKAVFRQQGLIEEVGYGEQAQSNQLMSRGRTRPPTWMGHAAKGMDVTAMIKGAAVASLLLPVPSASSGSLGNSSVGDPTKLGVLY
jgi:hypothetical protein